VGEANADPFYAAMETRVLEKINRLGIGPRASADASQP
jgi:tartrate dehydratase alpha subunit/fumarate hydratase class I-like protein